MTCKDCFHYTACDSILFWNTAPQIYREFRSLIVNVDDCKNFLNKKNVVIVKGEAADDDKL